MKRGGFQLCTLQCPASVRLCEGDAGLVSLGTRVLGLPKLELKRKRKHWCGDMSLALLHCSYPIAELLYTYFPSKVLGCGRWSAC